MKKKKNALCFPKATDPLWIYQTIVLIKKGDLCLVYNLQTIAKLPVQNVYYLCSIPHSLKTKVSLQSRGFLSRNGKNSG